MRSLWIILTLLPAPLLAQAPNCRLPATMPQVRPDLPDEDTPRRLVPIASYQLAISWSPQHCRSRPRAAGDGFQCDAPRRFGFVLHGLWPDGAGEVWPQYCRPTTLLPAPVLRAMLCATPSAQLIQHEWAKHGTCIPGDTPTGYFGKATRLFGALRYPDMDGLSRRPLTIGTFARRFAAANPGWRPEMMRVRTTREGWLDEVWLCLDLKLRPAPCPPRRGGPRPGSPLRIWRGGR